MNKQQFTKQVLEAEASLYHVAHTLLVNEEDCADAIQNAILAAYDKLGDLKKDAYFKTWLTRILINECYRILRVDSFHYNRTLTETERSRFDTLNQSYEEEGMFPKGALTVLESPEAYKGKGVGFYESRSTFFLPEQELTDEELLQLIDFYHQVNYSLQKVGGQIKQGVIQESESENSGLEQSVAPGKEWPSALAYEGDLSIHCMTAGADSIYLEGWDGIEKMEIGSRMEPFFMFTTDRERFSRRLPLTMIFMLPTESAGEKTARYICYLRTLTGRP